MVLKLNVEIYYPDTLDDVKFTPSLTPEQAAESVHGYIENGLYRDRLSWQVDDITVSPEPVD